MALRGFPLPLTTLEEPCGVPVCNHYVKARKIAGVSVLGVLLSWFGGDIVGYNHEESTFSVGGGLGHASMPAGFARKTRRLPMPWNIFFNSCGSWDGTAPEMVSILSFMGRQLAPVPKLGHHCIAVLSDILVKENPVAPHSRPLRPRSRNGGLPIQLRFSSQGMHQICATEQPKIRADYNSQAQNQESPSQEPSPAFRRPRKTLVRLPWPEAF